MTNYLQWLLAQGTPDFWLNGAVSSPTSSPQGQEWFPVPPTGQVGQSQAAPLSALPGFSEPEALSPSPWAADWLRTEGFTLTNWAEAETTPSLGGLPREFAAQLQAREQRLAEPAEALPRRESDLTAAALDRLFERDARRYDQGFTPR